MNESISSKIVPFQLSDLPQLVELSCETFRQAFQKMYPKDILDNYLITSFSLEHLHKELEDKESTFLGIQQNDRWIAYGKLRRSKIPQELLGQHVLELQRLYVHQDFWGKGIAHPLMTQLLDIARSEGFHKIWLGVWGKNYRAIRFYEKYGFVVIGSHTFQMSDTWLDEDSIMEKKL